MAFERSANSAPPDGDSEHEARIEEIVAGYVERLNVGEEVRPEQVLAQHPDIAGEVLDHLQCFLDFKPGPDESEPLGTLGDYTLRRQIGRGGMGVVYEAWENSMDRRVALKVLPAGVAADERALQRFVREAKTAGQLTHPNVVGVYGMGLKEQTPYFAMEFVEGETLAQVLAKLKDAQPEAETLFGKKDSVVFFGNLADTFADVAEGLQHAHSKGIIHRDIKPSNLILDREGRLRILDFGLAHLEGQESLTISGDVVGTPLYMSPEQARRRKIPVDHRTDIYSLGATLYEMVTLEPPFRGKDHADTLSQIIERDPVEPRKVNPRVPRDLETIVLKCLRKEVGDRYGTAEALGQDLRRFVRGDAIEARSQGNWERLYRRARRHRVKVLAGLGMLVLVLACVLLGVGFAIERKRERLRDYEHSVVRASMKLLRGELMGPNRVSESDIFLTRQYRTAFQATAVQAVRSAVIELQAAVTAFPDRVEGRYHLARGYLLLEQKDEAMQQARAVLYIESGFAPARSLLQELEGSAADLKTYPGWTRVWNSADQAMRKGSWKEATGLYGELIALEEGARRELYLGSSIENCLRRGLAYLGAKDYRRAVLDFQTARVLSRAYGPENLEPLLLLGQALHLDGQPKLAESLFWDAVNNSGGSDESTLWVAAIYSSVTSFLDKLNRPGEAADAARRAVLFRPWDPEVQMALGISLLRVIESNGDWGKHKSLNSSVAEFRELAEVSKTALDLGHGEPSVHGFLSKALEAQGDLVRAREEYQKAIEIESTRKGDKGMNRKETCKIVAIASAVALGHGDTGHSQDGYFEVDGRLMDSCVNSGGVEWGVGISRDDQKLIYGSMRGGGANLDLYMAIWDEDQKVFTNCRNLSELNSASWDTGASLSADGSTVYFESNRLGNGQFIGDLFQATWDPNKEAFTDVRQLSELDATNTRFRPSISSDGYELYFNEQRFEGDRNMDLWVAWRFSLDEPFTHEQTRPLTEINSPQDDFTPVISGDGKTLFWTGWITNSIDGGNDFVASSLWAATRSEKFDPKKHSDPPRFGGVLKIKFSPDVHIYSAAISNSWPAEGAKAYFVSCIDSQCHLLGSVFDIYSATWRATAPSTPFRRGDCNDDGIVDLSDAVFVSSHLFCGTAAPGCLAAADANGDGAIDISDATFVLNYHFLCRSPIVAPFSQCWLSALSTDVEFRCEKKALKSP